MADGDRITQLLQSGGVSPELASHWQAVTSLPPIELVHHTLEALLNTPLITYLASAPGPCALAEDAYPQIIAVLEAIDGVLSWGGAADHGDFICKRLDDIATKAFPAATASKILMPVGYDTMFLCTDVLRLSLLILVRCAGVSQLRANHVLNLANGDLATAVAIAVAAMKNPGSPPIPELQVRLWQVLYELSTPQMAWEVAARACCNETPIEERLNQHVLHAHRFAICLVQFGAVATVCSCAQNTRQRGSILVHFLRLLHNLSASEHLTAAGRILGRQLVIHWPQFGFKLIAPHLRRLLQAADGSALASRQAQRELRRDLRTFGWALHHCYELREHAKAVSSEIAMRAAKGNHCAETLAVAIGNAANSGALSSTGPLYHTLDEVDVFRKAAVRNVFPIETNRLWVIREAWEVVQTLGYWPETLVTDRQEFYQQREEEKEKGANLIDALSSLRTGFISDDESGDGPPSCDWDWHDNDEWGSWGDFEDNDWWSEKSEGEGPMSDFNVDPPPPLPQTSGPDGYKLVTELLCIAPNAWRCGIDGRLCSQPVRTPRGVLYERDNITAWLSWRKVCPVKGDDLNAAALTNDEEVSLGISRWLSMFCEGHICT